MATTSPVYSLHVMCTECGQGFNSGYAIGPQTTVEMTGNLTACPSCMTLLEIPSGNYGVMNGAMRWLGAVSTPEQRAELLEALREAQDKLATGMASDEVASALQKRAGIPISEVLLSSKSGVLAAWIAVMITLLMWWQTASEKPVQQTTVNNVTNITITMPCSPTQPSKSPSSRTPDWLQPFQR